MRQTHAAGERLFVDYAGDGVPVVIDRLTGEIRKAQIFVAVLGASSFTFARATWTQTLPDWIDAHVHAFDGDRRRAAASRAGQHQDRRHQGLSSMSPRSIEPTPRWRRIMAPPFCQQDQGSPRDKAKVEQAVLIVERWLLGRLRHRIFYSLTEVNAAIAEFLKLLNEERPIRRLGVTRRQLLEEIDRPALKALPAEPYVYSEWRDLPCRHRLSRRRRLPLLQRAPIASPAAEVDVRLTARTVEVFLKGERIAAHMRDERQPQAHDRCRAHAVQPSALRGVDD